jgi:hypothetical protein
MPERSGLGSVEGFRVVSYLSEGKRVERAGDLTRRPPRPGPQPSMPCSDIWTPSGSLARLTS